MLIWLANIFHCLEFLIRERESYLKLEIKFLLASSYDHCSPLLIQKMTGFPFTVCNLTKELKFYPASSITRIESLYLHSFPSTLAICCFHHSLDIPTSNLGTVNFAWFWISLILVYLIERIIELQVIGLQLLILLMGLLPGIQIWFLRSWSKVRAFPPLLEAMVFPPIFGMADCIGYPMGDGVATSLRHTIHSY